MAARAGPRGCALRYPGTSPITLPTVAHCAGRRVAGAQALHSGSYCQTTVGMTEAAHHAALAPRHPEFKQLL